MIKEIELLSRSEKILLINDLWDDVSKQSSDVDLTDGQSALLDARYQEFLSSPEEGLPWSQVKEQLKTLL
jgi:putative addiction module component (TIGR02574 family)